MKLACLRWEASEGFCYCCYISDSSWFVRPPPPTRERGIDTRNILRENKRTTTAKSQMFMITNVSKHIVICYFNIQRLVYMYRNIQHHMILIRSPDGEMITLLFKPKSFSSIQSQRHCDLFQCCCTCTNFDSGQTCSVPVSPVVSSARRTRLARLEAQNRQRSHTGIHWATITVIPLLGYIER